MRLWPAPALAALLLLVALAGCSEPVDGIAISHVHGVAYDAASGRLYLATHHGLARGEPSGGSWSWSYVGEPYDYMGFTQDTVAPGTFYSSGHPDNPRAFGGVHLGLRRSTDGGATWEQRSLKGETDFHALTALHGAEGSLAGYWQGKVKVSRDGGATWSDHAAPPAPVVALGSAPGRLLAGTTSGLWQTGDLAGLSGWAQVGGLGSSTVASVAASADGVNLLAGTLDGRTGKTYRSLDGGQSWMAVDHPALGAPAGQILFAFDAMDPRHAFAALGSGSVHETRDAGATWSKVR